MTAATPKMLLLDTSACIEIMRKRRGGIAAYLQRFESLTLLLSSIVLAELEFALSLAQQPQAGRIQMEELIARSELRSFDAAAASGYGPLRAHLRKLGAEIGPMDLLIAAHALALDVPVITGNVREFKRVPGLEVLALPTR